ncbi:hypothetical protein GCM10007049_05550 [Echinicola pacifica]|uniref:Uncharacterized protein n=1 Tax=Echinicola pacifica TaxID=346377 RepID=A0A918UJE3_9BACT|nr:hypothetical protein [Echinicola pacifica]GGZ16171.1 hypothetical protein GCM10007049_05550 [Echinicola pacifica]
MQSVIKLIGVVALAIVLLPLHSMGQGKDRSDIPAYKPYYDSLKSMDYPFTLPIWGKQAYKRGYDIPLAYGLSAIYFTQRQEILMEKILLGFNGSPQADFSDFIQFGPTIGTTNAYTFRPDIWVMPFLNLYGIIGMGTTETQVNLNAPINLQTTQRFNVNSYGLGMTLAGSLGPVWLTWDNNYNFANIEVVVEPVPAFNSGIRVGHTMLNATNPEKSLSAWVGVFYQNISNDTRGNIKVEEIFPGIGQGIIIDDLRTWADDLPIAQRVIANQIIDKIEDISNGIDVEDATIDYTLDKKVAAPFNIVLGSQYQFNKRIMLRTELGVFGKRSQFLLNLNYRFAGFRKGYKIF